VGAYLRPLEDARRSNVRFTTECLGFSNVPEPRAVEALLRSGESPFHHPRWKTRVPRDHGTGWDFEDVRDHYLAQLCGVDPMRLRYTDMDRYLALSRVVTGDLMMRTIGEWRRAGSTCHGALVWFFQDLWLGAGWGVIDSDGRPKAAYYALKRAMQPVAIAFTDEGANGLHLQIANDGPAELFADLEVTLLRGGATTVASAVNPVRVPKQGAIAVPIDGHLGRFHDSAYAYRFGPPGFDVAIASLGDPSGGTLIQAFHFPQGTPTARSEDAFLSGEARRVADDAIELTLRADRFAQSVALDCGDFIPEDNHFHMAPASERRILARSTAPGARFSGFAQPLNAHEGIRLALVSTAEARG
jgi:beta-mannosidase